MLMEVVMSQRNEVSEVNSSMRGSTWVDVFAGQPPKRIGSELRLAILLHGQQEQHSKAAFRSLDRRLQSLVPTSKKRPAREGVGGLGTRLIRSWRGARHEVMKVKAGFAYRGKVYGSLSEIARLITGARWSGPRFFGLKDPK